MPLHRGAVSRSKSVNDRYSEARIGPAVSTSMPTNHGARNRYAARSSRRTFRRRAVDADGATGRAGVWSTRLFLECPVGVLEEPRHALADRGLAEAHLVGGEREDLVGDLAGAQRVRR